MAKFTITFIVPIQSADITGAGWLAENLDYKLRTILASEYGQGRDYDLSTYAITEDEGE